MFILRYTEENRNLSFGHLCDNHDTNFSQKTELIDFVP